MSYKAQPRRTRRSNRGYLSTWLEWSTSKLGESVSVFTERTIRMVDEEHSMEDDQSTAGDVIQWTLRERSDWGEIKGFSRNAGTIQKDWTVILSHQLSKSFCIAVLSHNGWDKSMNDKVPYALAVSFEAVDQDIEIYQSMLQVNQLESELQQT